MKKSIVSFFVIMLVVGCRESEKASVPVNTAAAKETQPAKAKQVYRVTKTVTRNGEKTVTVTEKETASGKVISEKVTTEKIAADPKNKFVVVEKIETTEFEEDANGGVLNYKYLEVEKRFDLGNVQEEDCKAIFRLVHRTNDRRNELSYIEEFKNQFDPPSSTFREAKLRKTAETISTCKSQGLSVIEVARDILKNNEIAEVLIALSSGPK